MECPRSSTPRARPYFFAGRRFDTESDFYYNRLRYLDPRAGRFTVRDPVGSWTDGTNRGNGFGYVGASPHSALDPFGLWGLGRWILTGDGNAEDEVYDAAKTQFQETLWDRTDGTVRTLTFGKADAMSVTRVFTPSTWGQDTAETSHVFDPLEQAKAECFARCWAEQVCDTLTGLVMDKYNANVPIPFSACSGVKGLLVDKDPTAGVSRNEFAWTNWAMEKAAKGRIGDLGKLKSGKDAVLRQLGRDLAPSLKRKPSNAMRHAAGGGLQSGLSDKQIRRRIEGLADFDKQISKAKWLDRAGKALGGAALAYSLYGCFQDCEGDPCSH